MKSVFKRKNVLLICLGLMFCLNGYSKNEIVQSHRLISPLNIDGSAEDWEDIQPFWDNKVKTECAFKTDGKTLFVLYVFKDRKHLSTLQSSGLTVWFSVQEKKNKNYGITFLKKKVSADDYIVYVEKVKGPLSEEEKNKIRQNQFYIFHQALVREKKRGAASSSSEEKDVGKAVFRTKNQRKAIVYECAVPLKNITASSPEIGVAPGNIIRIGFEWGGMTEEYRRRIIQRQANSESRFKQAKGVSTRSNRIPNRYTRWVNVQLAKNQ